MICCDCRCLVDKIPITSQQPNAFPCYKMTIQGVGNEEERRTKGAHCISPQGLQELTVHLGGPLSSESDQIAVYLATPSAVILLSPPSVTTRCHNS